MKKRRYIYTNKKHPYRSIMATILGTISLVAVLAAIYITYLGKGQTRPGFGATGLLAGIFSLTGLGLGASGLSIRESFKLFSIIGVVLNAFMVILLGLLLFWGAGR